MIVINIKYDILEVLMNYLKQFGIIMTITFLGEMLKIILPVAIPASIYGLVIMLVALSTKIVKLDDVKDVGKFLIEIMPIMFIPSAVGLVVSWGILKEILIPVIMITLITTAIVMVVSGRVTQFIIRRERKKK